MTFNKIIWRRGRLIAPTAALSALGGFPALQMKRLKSFIATNQRKTKGKKETRSADHVSRKTP